VYTGGISVPLRYMHSQTEIISLKDVYRASKLLSHLLADPDLLGRPGSAGGAE
jgi:putative aminopeptidase FrvX